MPMHLVSLLLFLTSLGLHNTVEICKDYGVEFNREFVTEGQPLYVTCPLNYLFKDNEFNVTWYKNGSTTQISSETHERVHQNENLLSFIPARLEDGVFYVCVLSNSTYCIEKRIKVEVFRNDEGLCYNKSTMFYLENYVSPVVTITCPKLEPYFDIGNMQIQWFKECQPLDFSINKYHALKKDLIILNVTTLDEGNYTCEILFEHNTTKFTISRAIDLSFRVPAEIIAPVILTPMNNKVEVELGSPINLACIATFKGDPYSVYWTYNNTMVDDYYNSDRVVIDDMQSSTTQDDRVTVITYLNFSEVKEEDYNRKFFCEVYSKVKAYVILKRPDPNLQIFLIAFFVSFVFAIVAVLLIIKIFKVDIVLWYRSSCFIQPNTKDGKLYDAYVMYPRGAMGSTSYTMDIFVLKILPEVLERQCAYRLFIFGRDELPGQAVADLIDEAISQSRRLVIVLENSSSDNSLGNDFEQQIAMYDALIRNKLKVILIELEKITDYVHMPESIKYIKQKQGVARWKGELTEAALSPNTKFWKNIRYRMPPTQGQNSQVLNYISSEDI